MKRRILIICIIVAMLASLAFPAAADTASVSLPGLPLALPKGMLVITRKNHAIPRVGLGWITQDIADDIFDSDPERQLYAYSQEHDYELYLYQCENTEMTSFSQVDESGMEDLATAYTQKVLQNPKEDLEDGVRIIRHPQTSLLYYSTSRTAEGNTDYHLFCQTIENGMLVTIELARFVGPPDEMVKAEFEAILQGLVFSGEPFGIGMLALLAAAYPAWAQTVNEPGVIRVDIPEGFIWFSRQMHDVKELGLEEQGFDQEIVDLIFQTSPDAQIYAFSPEPFVEIQITYEKTTFNGGPIPQGMDRTWLKTMLPAFQEGAEKRPDIQLEEETKIESFPSADFLVAKTKGEEGYATQYITLGNEGFYQIELLTDAPATPDQEALLNSLVASAVFPVSQELEQVSFPQLIYISMGEKDLCLSIPMDWQEIEGTAGIIGENVRAFGNGLGTLMTVSWEDRWQRTPAAARAQYGDDPKRMDVPGTVLLPALYPQSAMPEGGRQESFESFDGTVYGLVLWEEKKNMDGVSDTSAPFSQRIDCIAVVDGMLYTYCFHSFTDMQTLRAQMKDILNTVMYPAW